jgi:hypothetical protein
MSVADSLEATDGQSALTAQRLMQLLNPHFRSHIFSFSYRRLPGQGTRMHDEALRGPRGPTHRA